MGKLRRFKLKHSVEQEMFGSGRQPLLTSDHMTNFHGEIVNDIRKMISWEAIVLENDLVVHVLVIPYDLAMNDVLELSLTFWHFHSDDIGITVSFFLLNLFLRVIVQAKAVILCLGVFLTTNLNTHLLKAFGSAETGIGITILHQCLDILMVDGQPFALVVWSIRSHCLPIHLLLVDRTGTFIPIHAGPLEHLHDVINATFDFSLLVSVFYSEDHFASMHLCEEIIVEEGTKAANVHQTGWAGCVSDPNFVSQRFISTVFDLCYLAKVAIVRVELGIDILTSWISTELPPENLL